VFAVLGGGGGVGVWIRLPAAGTDRRGLGAAGARGFGAVGVRDFFGVVLAPPQLSPSPCIDGVLRPLSVGLYFTVAVSLCIGSSSEVDAFIKCILLVGGIFAIAVVAFVCVCGGVRTCLVAMAITGFFGGIALPCL
jgi:hypothetical protein